MDDGRGGLVIREASTDDAAAIARVYSSAFPAEEAKIVGAIAQGLLEANIGNIDSLVAELDGAIVAHVAFSPVEVGKASDGRILCPLAVHANHQSNGVGSALVKRGIELCTGRGAAVIFVYGDPKYYGRFGFAAAVAAAVTPPHPLSQPEGWLGLRTSSSNDAPLSGALGVVTVLDDPTIW